MYTNQAATHRHFKTGSWLPAKIVDKAREPNSYIVQTPTGQILRRNREHIREVPQNTHQGTSLEVPATKDNAQLSHDPDAE